MLHNVEAILNDPELDKHGIAAEWRAWAGDPQFHAIYTEMSFSLPTGSATTKGVCT